MSGIAGQVNLRARKVDCDIIKEMIASLEHRGRDEVACFAKNNVALANNRHNTFSQSEEMKWSFLNEDQTICMSYDGEVFNYPSLRKELMLDGYSFNTKSDAEVLFKAYQEYGMSFLTKLNGSYAIAICDFKRNKLYLARDILGTKPLYYYQNSDNIFFASEIKAFTDAGVYTPEIDPFGLKDYLYIQLYIGQKTLFKNITSVPEASYMEIDLTTGNIKTKQYWTMPEDEAEITYEYALDKLEDLITKSVKACCNIDGDLAAYISGGLDSSTVTSIAAKHMASQNRDLFTYSSIYPYMDFQDEHRNSSLVAENITSEHADVVLSIEQMLDVHKNNLMYRIDMPEAGYAAPYILMSENTRKKSKAVLTGNGGDEFFAGYPKYISANIAHQLNKCYSGEDIMMDANIFKYIKGYEMLAKNIIQKSLFADEKKLVQSLYYRTSALWDLVCEDIKDVTKHYDVSEELLNIYKHRKNGFWKKMMYLDQKVLLKGLLHIEDRTSMTANISSRSPLLSKDIIEFSALLPEAYLYKSGLKGMIRDVAKRHIPIEVATCKNKSGMIYPVPEFLNKYMSNDITQSILALNDTEIFDKTKFKTIHDLANEPIYNRTSWGLWCISTWHDSYLKNKIDTHEDRRAVLCSL